MKKTLIYDCEVANSPLIKGWSNWEGLGISVIGCIWANEETAFAFDNRDPNYLVKFQKTVQQAEKIVGFNSRNFDDQLCNWWGVNINTTIDLLEEFRIMSGQPPKYTRGVTKAGYSLDAIVQENGLGAKTGHGADAPKLWQQGKYKEVIDYCLNDVLLTKRLYLMWREGILKDPTTGALLYRTTPAD